MIWCGHRFAQSLNVEVLWVRSEDCEVELNCFPHVLLDSFESPSRGNTAVEIGRTSRMTYFRLLDYDQVPHIFGRAAFDAAQRLLSNQQSSSEFVIRNYRRPIWVESVQYTKCTPLPS